MTRQSSVITGVGIVSAIGTGQSEFFQSLLEARCGFRSLGERTDGEATPGENDAIDGVWIGAPVVDFKPKLHVKPRKALKVMCREIQTAFASAHLAVAHAGLAESIPATDDGVVTPERLAAIYGSEVFYNPPQELEDTTNACIDENGVFHPGQFGGAARHELMPLWMLKYLPNMPACQVGISLNSQGPNNTLVLGDVSGPASLLEGESYLDRDLADVVLVGATGTRIAATRMIYHRDSPVPERGDGALPDAARPHDPESSGVVGGEAAVFDRARIRSPLPRIETRRCWQRSSRSFLDSVPPRPSRLTNVRQNEQPIRHAKHPPQSRLRSRTHSGNPIFEPTNWGS